MASLCRAILCRRRSLHAKALLKLCIDMNALDENQDGPPGQPEIQDATEVVKNVGSKATFTRNSIISMLRLFVTAGIALVLPGYLTHKMPIKTYAAWVLILQVSSYVSYLDFGIQTAISKFVAEYRVKQDAAGLNMRASAGLLLMLLAGALGIVLTLILAWCAPQLFHDIPSDLYGDIRVSIILVGISLSLGLVFSIFSSIFLGLQRFTVPMIIGIVNRFLFTGMVLGAAAYHLSLATMGALVAFTNVFTGLLQFEAWRRWGRSVRLSLASIDRSVVRKMFVYCSSLAIWNGAMLFISGLDLTIVGRYDFGQTACYSVAALRTTFGISILGAALAALMPTTSALSVLRTPEQMGMLLAKVTRYASILLIVSSIPLLVGGYWMLRIWVGPTYATNAIGYLRILVIANVLRNMCMPYASMLVATDNQKVGIFCAIAEAVVNLTSSIYLGRRFGAIGVAYGTLIGSFVSVGVHFVFNMHFTYSQFSISRTRLFLNGLARPFLIALPSLLLFRLWWLTTPPALTLPMWTALVLSTLLIAWFIALDSGERTSLVHMAGTRLMLRTR